MLHVPYRGGANALVDITAGRTDLMFGNMPEFLGQIEGKGVRAIAFGAAQASPLFPDLPLVSQTVPEFKIGNWFGLVGPASCRRTWSPSGPPRWTRSPPTRTSGRAWPRTGWRSSSARRPAWKG